MGAFTAYPDINDANFLQRLYNKREFRKNMLKNDTSTVEELCDPQKAVILANQKWIAQYINPKTPYRGLLLFWATGSGKTSGIIQIAEQFKLEISEKIIILVKNEKIKNQFMSHLTGCTGPLVAGNEYASDKEREIICSGNHPSKEKTELAIGKRIRKFYNIVTYDTFINKNKETAGVLEHTVIFIDEAHNFRSDNNRYKNFKGMLDKTKIVTIVLATATPMFNSDEELLDIFNLLLRSDQQLKNLNKEKVAEISRYLVSYVGHDAKVFPTVINNPDKSVAMYGTHVIRVEMGKFQKEHYQKHKDDTSTFRLQERQASNFIFPDKTIGTVAFSNSLKKDSKYIAIKKTIIGPRKNKIEYVLKDKNLADPIKLKDYSNKFLTLLNILKKNIKDKKGPAIVFSNFVSGGGIILLHLILKHNGIDNTMLIGNTTGTKKIIAKWNRGEISVLLGSEAISEGIDFKVGSAMHIVNPPWSPSELQQIIGRIVRRCANVGNKVEIYRYMTANSVDEEIYASIAKKEKNIKEYELIMQNNAVDCVFNQDNCPVTVLDEPIDSSTYVITETDFREISDKIVALFDKQRIAWSLGKIQDQLPKSLFIEDIYTVLGLIVNNEIPVVYHGVEGYIIHRGNYYLFQPKGKSKKMSLQERLEAVPIEDIKTVKISSLNVSELGPLSPTIQKLLGPDFYRIGVMGAGSCFFHAILEATNKEYQNSSSAKKAKLGTAWRTQLAKTLVDNWEKFKYAERFPFEMAYYKKLFADCSAVVGEEAWVYISDVLNINLFIFRLSTDSIYCGFNYYKADRPTVLIANIKDNHYEPIIKIRKASPEEERTSSRVFKGQSELVKRILKFYDDSCTKGKSADIISGQLPIKKMPEPKKATTVSAKLLIIPSHDIVGIVSEGKFLIVDNRSKADIKDKRLVNRGKVCETWKKEDLLDVAKFLKIDFKGGNKGDLCSAIKTELETKKWVVKN